MKQFFSAISVVCCLQLVSTFTTAQRVGIGTSLPQARLHVADSNVLFTGIGLLPIGVYGTAPANGAGRRMMWYVGKAAFRAGSVTGTNWDTDNIGLNSAAFGIDSKAKGVNSFAAGFNTSAMGDHATSLGYETDADGTMSTAMGSFSRATGAIATSLGTLTLASGSSSFAAGQEAVASGSTATSMGLFTVASGNFSMAVNNGSNASGANAFAANLSTRATGFASFAVNQSTTASGEGSFSANLGGKANGENTAAFGFSTVANAYSSMAIGIYNDSLVTAQTTEGGAFAPLFIVGNGDGNSSRSNAMVVRKNGTVSINGSQSGTKLDVNGDVAHRQNIITLSNATNNNITTGTFSFVKIEGPTNAFSITGIQNGSDGKILTLLNLTGQNMTIVNQSGLSNADNRINTLTGTDISTNANGSVTLQYSIADNRWMVISIRD